MTFKIKGIVDKIKVVVIINRRRIRQDAHERHERGNTDNFKQSHDNDHAQQKQRSPSLLWGKQMNYFAMDSHLLPTKASITLEINF